MNPLPIEKDIISKWYEGGCIVVGSWSEKSVDAKIGRKVMGRGRRKVSMLK